MIQVQIISFVSKTCNSGYGLRFVDIDDKHTVVPVGNLPTARH